MVKRNEKIAIYYFALIQIAALILSLMGCATQGKSVGLGGAIGAGTGAVLGGIADPGKDGEYRTRNVVVGSAFGGMAGMIAGSAIFNSTEKQKREAFQKGKASVPQSKQGTPPSLREPKVESRWVEGKIVGNRFVEGHFEYIIIEPARWEEN
ncbi:MAG: hypothetical protein AB7F59_09590 [Bdellovibrionales bacterium]